MEPSIIKGRQSYKQTAPTHLHETEDGKTLNLMIRFKYTDLDLVFVALSHSVRRATLEALVDGACGVSDLAAPHRMSLVGFMKHVRVLEEARLIACEKEGRVVRCVLAPERIRHAAAWLARYEQSWNMRLGAGTRDAHEEGWSNALAKIDTVLAGR